MGGLLKLGVEPSQAESVEEFEASHAPDTILIWEDTSAEWMTACVGAFSQSIVVATSYATLGPEGAAEAINQCECTVVVTNRSKVADLAAMKKKCPTLQHIIATDVYVAKEDQKPFEETINGVKIHSFESVIELGAGGNATHRPKADTMAVIMYTSGSTGRPKGVLIMHKNICASATGLRTVFAEWGEAGAETYLAYLPAAHILELVAELAMLSFGCAVGYADPRTISSKGACRRKDDGSLQFKPDLDNAPGAIQEFKPTVMAGVPKIWDIFKKGAEEVIGSGSPVLRFVFDVAFSGKALAERQGRSAPLLGLVFKKLKAMIGGRMKVAISGGGPIASDCQTFIRTAMSMPLIQGYALTETTCAGTVQDVRDVRDGVVGSPLPSVEIKLNSCEEVKDREDKPYLSSDTRHYDGSACKGRGEVWIRGPSVSQGYYARGEDAEELKKKREEEFDSNGWFHTGDIGLITPDGSLKLVDRLKNLIKLKGGEYIAVENMEKEFLNCKYIDSINGGLMVYGDGDMDRPVAILQANVKELQKYADENGIKCENSDQLCTNKDVLSMVVNDLKGYAKTGGLSPLEVLCAVHLITGEGSKTDATPTSPWTPENEFLTASNKLNRGPIKKHLAGILEVLKQKGIR
jgi:long-chain acyl-CoA synthetase